MLCGAVVIGFLATHALWAQAVSYTFVTMAGRPVRGSMNGAAATAAFYRQQGVAVDANGVIFIADTLNHVIRRIGTDGVVSTVTGAAGVAGCQSGLGATVRLASPRAIVADNVGSLYFTDSCGIRKFGPDGTVSMMSSSFGSVAGLLVDGADSIYFTASHRIYRLTISTLAVATFSGTGVAGYADGAGTSAQFNQPTGITRDASSNLYVTDAFNYVVRKITTAGVVSTVAQIPRGSVSTDGAYSIGINGATNVLYVADTVTHQILSISPSGDVAVVAGAYELAGPVDGTGTAARFNYPYGLAVDGAGDIIVSDTFDNIMRKVTPAGVVTTIAGIAGGSGATDGTRTASRFNDPRGVAVTPSGDVFVADYNNCLIRKITTAGTVTTFAGTPSATTSPSCGSTDGTGTAAKFSFPSGLASDGSGNLFVADTANSVIRKITPAGVVTTFAGTAGTVGSSDGTGAAASFSVPQGVAVDPTTGTLYVADTGNSTIRQITSAGVVTTLAGLAGTSGNTDGTGTAARFQSPTGVAVYTSGLYVADQSNHTIRKIVSGGVVTTLAGSAGSTGTSDGTGTSARFFRPSSVAVDASGNIFVASNGSPTIRMVTSAGVVTTIGGSTSVADFADGLGTAARFNEPYGVAVDAAGNLYVADTKNYAIRVGLVAAASAPVIDTHPANTTINPGATATFTVAASGNLPPSLQWQVSTDRGQTWANLAASSPYSGTTSTTLTITSPANTLDGYRYRAVATNLSGTANSTSATLTIVQMTTSPASLRFGATKSGASGALTATTRAQTVTVSFSGTTSTWTAAVNQTWVEITGGSGSGSGQFTVAIVNPGNVIGGSTSLSATITVTPASSTVTAATIPVTLTIDQVGTSTVAPVGQVDTPAQSATGVVGAIGVTGWVIDDVGVDTVKVYRGCLSGEPQVNCDTSILSGQSLVYIGDAVLVNGARPDVEAAFPTYPAGNLAGFGLAVLTNMLPRTTGTFAAYGGQGPITFYVMARDVEGHSTLLGRAYTGDQTPTSITMDNDNIAKPFGTLDTPGQGATVSGTFANFGWELTPDANQTVDAGDILVPTNGSTSFVFIDGTPVAPVGYNQCRGTVGNPVPSGQYCNDDVANIFGNTTPLASGTARLSNPTRFRNLDAGRGAIGAYVISTPALGNGLHTIAWSVTDSASRVEGLGSRFFTVLNSSVRPGSPLTAARAQAEPAMARGTADQLDTLWRASDVLQGRAGFNLATALGPVSQDASGVSIVNIPAAGRLELQLGAVDGGYLVANGTVRDLPPGSRLDSPTGAFTWAPGPGYLGTYRLVFVRGSQQIPVDVTIRSDAQTAPGESEVRMEDTRVQGCKGSGVQGFGGSGVQGFGGQGCSVTGPVTLTGRAWDPQAFTGSGIGAVHVWSQEVQGFKGARVQGFMGAASLNADGTYTLTRTLERGVYDVTAYVWNIRTGRFEDARTVRVTVR